LIKRISLHEFSCFGDLNIDFSNNINIFCGKNGIGKTHILKTLYSITKSLDEIRIKKADPLSQILSKEKSNDILVNKFINVYRTEKIGRLVRRKQGRNKATIKLTMTNNEIIELAFSRQSVNKVILSDDLRNKIENIRPVYIPPKEIISATENFSQLYDEYHIAFEETYADLAKLLLSPIRKGKNTAKQNTLKNLSEQVIQGKVILKDDKFYLKSPGEGELEMGLVAEGYRKWATIIQLIQNGILTKNSLLFWDEPESNINPMLIKPTVDLLIKLAEMGVQIFISTHSYFLLQEFELYQSVNRKNAKKMDINIYSLYKKNDDILCEVSKKASELENNVIYDEFENLYNREQEIFYED
jgi:predicted ATPase